MARFEMLFSCFSYILHKWIRILTALVDPSDNASVTVAIYMSRIEGAEYTQFTYIVAL